MALELLKPVKDEKETESSFHPGWESEEVYNNGDDFFQALLSEISQANTSIEMESYIFERDIIGSYVLEALKQAASLGVRVRVMVDGVGSSTWNIKTLTELKESGVEARIYHPLPWVWLRFKARIKFFKLRHISILYHQINRRNHRKLCLIDHRVAWLGSMNVTAQHLNMNPTQKAWRDTGVRVEGESVGLLRLAFEKSWIRAWTPFQTRIWSLKRLIQENQGLFASQNILVRLNNSHLLRKRYYLDLLNRIRQARDCVWITNAYFIPRGSLIHALREAAQKGVDVRVLLPGKSDVRIVRWVSISTMARLLSAGVRIYEYLPSILHAKTVVIDDWATIGSTNFNHRSLIHDLEVDVVVQHPSSLEKLKSGFINDLKVSNNVTFKKWKRSYWLERWMGRIFSVLRYWL